MSEDESQKALFKLFSSEKIVNALEELYAFFKAYNCKSQISTQLAVLNKETNEMESFKLVFSLEQDENMVQHAKELFEKAEKAEKKKDNEIL